MFNPLKTNIPLISKPVSWFAAQIYMMDTLFANWLTLS